MAKPILDNARIAEQIPLKHAMKRVGKPEDLAETAKFLLLPLFILVYLCFHEN